MARKAHSPESVLYRLPAHLPGVEMLRARYVTQNFSRHFHEGYALGVIEHGAMEFDYLRAKYVAAAGSVNLVIPGEVHDGHAVDGSGWSYRMFYLAPEVVDAVARQIGFQGRDIPAFTTGVLQDPELAARIRSLHCMIFADSLGRLETVNRFLELLQLWIGRHADHRSTGQAPDAPRGVRLAREYLHEHYADQDLGLAELARAACLSPFHLARQFRKHLGLPPHAYLTQIRVYRAKALLQQGRALADVAACTGFADQSHLTRRFKQVLGATPGGCR